MIRQCIPLSLFLGMIIVLSGCGGKNSTPSSMTGTPVSFSGNYELTAVSQSTPGVNFFIRGFLEDDASGMITGSVPGTSIGGGCFNTVGGTLTGSVDSAGNLSLSFQSGDRLHLLSIKGALSADKQTITGSFTTDSVCGGTGTVAGFAMQPFTGTYKGSVTTAGGTLNLSFVSNQGTINSGFGTLPLTGTINLADSGVCAILPPPPSFQLVGAAAGAAVNMDSPKGVELSALIFTGTATDHTATVIKGTIFLDGCVVAIPLVLTKQ